VCVCLKKADLISKTNLKKFEISFRQVFNLYHYHYLNHFKSPFHSFYLFLSRTTSLFLSFPLLVLFSTRLSHYHSLFVSLPSSLCLPLILPAFFSLSFFLHLSFYNSLCIALSIINCLWLFFNIISVSLFQTDTPKLFVCFFNS
jgi:hypothetical protein